MNTYIHLGEELRVQWRGCGSERRDPGGLGQPTHGLQGTLKTPAWLLEGQPGFHGQLCYVAGQPLAPTAP